MQLIESTRPRSMVKFGQDLSDIKYLLKWLAEHNEKVDFAGYFALKPDKVVCSDQGLDKTLEGDW